MIANEHIVVGLDVGTSKICAAVGERLPSGDVSMIGLGECESRGIRKGEIVNREQAEACIREAVGKAEETAGVEIRNVTVTLTGGHIRSFNNRGVVPITGENHEITEADVEAVIRNAKAVNIPVQNDVLHTLHQHFYVDGQDGVLDPVGITGAKLVADVHVIHGVRTRLQNTIRCVKAVGLEVDDAVFGGLASAFGILTPHDKEIGCIVIDCGAGTTEFVVYVRDSIKHSGVLAVGGDHLTNDVATGLKIPLRLAEQLKREHGSVLPDDAHKKKTIPIQNEGSFTDRREINRNTLCQILQLRAAETFSLLKQEIQRYCSLEYIGAGVFLCGGGSQLRGLDRLAQDVFGLPAHIVSAFDTAGIATSLKNPQFTAAVGLVKYGFQTQQAPRPIVAPLAALGNRLISFFARARNIF